MSALNSLLDRALNTGSIRSLAWRLGRRIYMGARGEIANEPDTNGEYALQRQVIDVWARSGDRRPLRILDVGANRGEWSAHALKQLAELGRRDFVVHLFEPVSGTAELARQTVAPALARGVALLHKIALSSREGEVEIHVVLGGGGTSSLHADPTSGEKSIERVPTERVDHFLTREGIEYVLFLKCDTEGNDLQVLQGARESLARGAIGVFQFEYNHRWLFSRSSRNCLLDVFELIEGLPYELGRVRARGIEFVERWHPELDRFFESNWVLVHRSLVPLLPHVNHGQIGGANVYVSHA